MNYRNSKNLKNSVKKGTEIIKGIIIGFMQYRLK